MYKRARRTRASYEAARVARMTRFRGIEEEKSAVISTDRDMGPDCHVRLPSQRSEVVGVSADEISGRERAAGVKGMVTGV